MVSLAGSEEGSEEREECDYEWSEGRSRSRSRSRSGDSIDGNGSEGSRSGRSRSVSGGEGGRKSHRRSASSGSHGKRSRSRGRSGSRERKRPRPVAKVRSVSELTVDDHTRKLFTKAIEVCRVHAGPELAGACVCGLAGDGGRGSSALLARRPPLPNCTAIHRPHHVLHAAPQVWEKKGARAGNISVLNDIMRAEDRSW